jgi:hypothetical protein
MASVGGKMAEEKLTRINAFATAYTRRVMFFRQTKQPRRLLAGLSC